MKTRQGDGTKALSQEMESNGSATPKSRRHPLTLLCPDKSSSAYWSRSESSSGKGSGRQVAGNGCGWVIGYVEFFSLGEYHLRQAGFGFILLPSRIHAGPLSITQSVGQS